MTPFKVIHKPNFSQVAQNSVIFKHSHQSFKLSVLRKSAKIKIQIFKQEKNLKLSENKEMNFNLMLLPLKHNLLNSQS